MTGSEPPQLPPLTFHSGLGRDISATSADLHAFLQTIISENLGDGIRIIASEKPNWVALIGGLSEHFLARFPSSGSSSWNALEEKTKLCFVSLEVIERASSRVDTLFLDSDDHSSLILSQILSFLAALASWDVPATDATSYGSIALREKAIAAGGAILRCMNENGTGRTRFCKVVGESMLQSAKYIIDSFHIGVWPYQIPDLKIPKGNLSDTEQILVKVELESALHSSILLVDIIRVAACSARLEGNYLSSDQRLIIYLLRQTLDILLSPKLTASVENRAMLSARLLETGRILGFLDRGSRNSLTTIPSVLLIFRLKVGPDTEWKPVDDLLLVLFGVEGWKLEPANMSLTILEIILGQDWGHDGITLMECAISSIKSSMGAIDLQTKQTMLAKLSSRELPPDLSSLRSMFQAGPASDPELETFKVLGKRRRDEAWRKEVIQTLQINVLGDETDWIPDDNLNDAMWIAQVLDKVKAEITKPGPVKSVEWRLKAINSLQLLACAFAHPDHTPCHETMSQRPAVSLIPVYLACLTKMQEGPESEGAPLILKAAQGAFSTCLRHHSQGFSEEKFSAAKDFIKAGLQDPSRSTRLAAGRSIVELVLLYQRLGRGMARYLDIIMVDINDILKNCKDSIKETTLICLGVLGRMDDTDVLGRILQCLFVHIGHRNILLRGVAYTQLLALAKCHEKTPYVLVSPYMERIAVHVASVMIHQPNTLIETCRFLSFSTSDFLSVTLPLTLPYLIGDCNRPALDKLSSELNTSISNMFLKVSADVLAHVFLLRDRQDTNKALSFILRILNEAATHADIQLSNVVKSCVLPLLGKLVISMGDPNPEAAANAAQAIRKVERSLGITTGSASRPNSSQSIGVFLKGNMLAIIAHLNDVLQDVQGRQTPQTKKKVILGLNALIKEVGPAINSVAPQIMATLQTTISMPPLSECALQTWYTFLTTLSLKDIGPHVGPTTASIVNAWPKLSMRSRRLAQESIEYLLSDSFSELGSHLSEVVDFSGIPELASSTERIRELRRKVPVKDYLGGILDRLLSDNLTVVGQGLQELKSFMLSQHSELIRNAASGDIFDPLVGKIVKAVMTVACRDGEDVELLRLLAYECIGILGAVDPDRFDIPNHDSTMVVVSNFTDEDEAMQFALHLVQTTLVGMFRSTSDIKYQSHLAFAIQELLRLCKFTPDLLMPGTSVPIKVRSRWATLPKHVHETVSPLLEARFTVNKTTPEVPLEHPIYKTQTTYREWIQLWTTFLITRVNGKMAKKIFDTVRLIIRYKDASVAHQLLPHLVLNILIAGDDEDTAKIRTEISLVLEDQLDEASQSSPEKQMLSAQAIFMLMDHLNKWVRIMRLEMSAKRTESRRSRNYNNHEAEMQVTRVDSILESIDQVLIAKAAFQCKSYARSLMNFEKHILTMRVNGTTRENQQVYFDKLHEIYSHLDEPDGMEGVSTFVILPSIEHQIRQHESTGRWTSAQSCWEVRLQQSPDKLDYHLGLLRCLRNLGHYDSLRTHIQGILVRNPEWEKPLSGFRLEGAWMSGDWQSVGDIVTKCPQGSWEHAIAHVLLAFKSQDEETFAKATAVALMSLGAPVTGAGEIGYRRAYDAVLKLHLVYDIQLVRKAILQLQRGGKKQSVLPDLFDDLSHRLNLTLPTFRVREPILSIHRTAFALSQTCRISFKKAVGKTWLESAKIARKAGHWQTAYSAVLQAQECRAPLTFFQSAKLVRASGEPLRALYELDNALQATEERLRPAVSQRLMDLTEDEDDMDDKEWKRLHGKAKLLRARWMQESERYDVSLVAKLLSELTQQLPDVETAHFHAGHFQDEQFKQLGNSEKRNRGIRMNLFTIRSYVMALRLGSKFAYQTIPRLLTLWLDMGEDDKLSQNDIFKAVNAEIQNAITHIPEYKWFTAFPQIVSRVDHRNSHVFILLSQLIVAIISEYPQQGLWLFMSSVKSTKTKREKRGRAILEQLKNNPQNSNTIVPGLIASSATMSTELLNLCDFPIRDDSTRTLSMSKDIPNLARLVPSPLIIPLQESMTVSLPATSSTQSVHQPFPPDTPTIATFYDEIDIMKSLAKPRKITIQGSDGKIYMFLGKPKDDLRKDARLMDFNSIINKLLRTNSESRRRQLRIRTYSVVTLNEECGFIQWVPNTTPIRPILLKYYAARGLEAWHRDMSICFSRIKEASDKEACKLFQEKILSVYKPVFHEWFLDTFPEPTAWLSSRLAYGRTAAVMCMVGFILGLGDRHLENILLDMNTGDAVHVDFNCLFEKGKTLETPERVPFRLTQNMVDGLGVTGVEGVFRNASEITMQLLRDNKDVLMSVLDAFIHDPLVEWEDEKRKIERQARRGDVNAVKEAVDLRKLAKNALNPIEKKLKGIYAKESIKGEKEKEVSTSNLVQMLIEEAMDLRNLAKMYPGWSPWH